MSPDELKVAIIVATTGSGHLFVEYLFIIYLSIVENKVWQFQI
jgi:hypothetical protein